MIRHDLRLVRMLPLDETLHCEKHGLLQAEEAADCYRRAGLTQATVAMTGPSSLWHRILDAIAHLSRPRCEYVQ